MSSHPSTDSNMKFEPLDGHPDAHFLTHGAAADIWTLRAPMDPSHSARRLSGAVHKVLRIDPMSSELAVFGTESHKDLWQGFLEDYRAKVNQWKSLEHENLVQVLGFGDGLNLMVEMCERGSVREYLKTNPHSYPTKLDIMTHTLMGLQYLHTRVPPIVHGNLTAGKLFIDAAGATKIGEFGLAALCYPFSTFVPSVSFVGLVRWSSPELLSTNLDSVVKPTTASDIWALGCVFLEIVAETIPHSACKHDMRVRRNILAGVPPGQLDEHFKDQPFDFIWSLLVKCWEIQPERRPSVLSLLQQASPVLQAPEHQVRPQFPSSSSPFTVELSAIPANTEDSSSTVLFPVSPAGVRTGNDLLPQREAYSASQISVQSLSPNPPVATLEDAREGGPRPRPMLQPSFRRRDPSPPASADSGQVPVQPPSPNQHTNPRRRGTFSSLIWKLTQPSSSSQPTPAPASPSRAPVKSRFSKAFRVASAGSQSSQPSSSHHPTATPLGATERGTDGWPRLRSLLLALDRSPVAFDSLEVVASGLVECIEIYENASSNSKELDIKFRLEGLCEELEGSLALVDPSVMTAGVEYLCRSIQRELDYVPGKQDARAAKGPVKAEGNSDEVLACYLRICAYVQHLVFNISPWKWRYIGEAPTDDLLRRWRLSLSAYYNSSEAARLDRRACSPGTCVDALGEIHNWIHDPQAGPIYWQYGMAGTGKTTIAYTLCADLDANYQLGASFFCSRLLPGCRDADKIVPSIAYQLAQFSRPFRCVLSEVLEREPDIHTRRIQVQFENLIVGPLLLVREALPEGVVVVIDGLDECDDRRSIERILDALFRMTPNLPIKFFVSSRPEHRARDLVHKRDDRRASSQLESYELTKDLVQGDIEAYLRNALRTIQPTNQLIGTLVRHAGKMFIYAATVAWYINHEPFWQSPHDRLEAILGVPTPTSDSPYGHIDELYTIILGAAINNPDLTITERDDVKQVLYSVVYARGPLTIHTLSESLGLRDVERVQSILQPLWSVLHVVEPTGLVTARHTSFLDYIIDPTRSKEYHCDPATPNRTLTKWCFDCIRVSKPRFNICELQSSYIPDDKVPNLNARVEQAISFELSYACCSWASHLEYAEGVPEVREWLQEFLSTQLLIWMEVMNLKKYMRRGVGLVQQAERWCMRNSCSEELMQLMHDSRRFVEAFTSSAVSQSTPHIYVSMLPFWPESNPITKHYAQGMRVPMVPQGPAIAQRSLERLATWSVDGQARRCAWSPDGSQIALLTRDRVLVLDGLTGQVALGPLKQDLNPLQSIAYSYDGTRIVSGSKDGAIHVWDAEGGEVIGLMKGHSDEVHTVAFLPDDARIVSGSNDKTIIVWDARSGTMVLGPLYGHSNAVTSVGCSADGTRAVSGSADKTIRVWNLQNGQILLGPLEGHTGPVTSVGFSPNGTQIVSGSVDSTICVWDIQHGRTVLGPLHGHSDRVMSVECSPDGTHIVSSSADKTIRVWDIQTGQTVIGPLKGHAGPVTSAKFSPDSARIVSCSWDETICVWDILSGQATPGPQGEHDYSVNSVAFSPDGTCIVSGSDDGIIRVWDIPSRKLALNPLEGHSHSVKSVAFSPSGTCIVSGSDDRTICVWDIHSGQLVLGPLEGHTGSINSVGFSSDSTHIVSGSDDHTIRMWAAQSGQLVLGPLEGHSNSIKSVAFSPSGTLIVSGSNDRAICVWDTYSGQMILGPLTGHVGSVNSVGFSPDGTRIVSGSDDKTISVWDARSGHRILGPLCGHTDGITSVVCSPDGHQIISSSVDKTIRLWDMESGQMVPDPLEGHTGPVTSVGLSPNGMHIVSGSGDSTICMWALQGRQTSPYSTSSAPVYRKVDVKGWVTDSRSRLLVWVPPDLRHCLLNPNAQIIFKASPKGYVYLDFRQAQIGERWTNCYQPV